MAIWIIASLLREAFCTRSQAIAELPALGTRTGAAQSQRSVPRPLRVYWSSRDTNVTNDLPSESRLLPAQWDAVKVE
jgi:hypothetical protein